MKRQDRADEAKREAATKPNRDDVHEQREPAQPREGTVRKGAAPGAGTPSPGATSTPERKSRR